MARATLLRTNGGLTARMAQEMGGSEALSAGPRPCLARRAPAWCRNTWSPAGRLETEGTEIQTGLCFGGVDAPCGRPYDPGKAIAARRPLCRIRGGGRGGSQTAPTTPNTCADAGPTAPGDTLPVRVRRC